MNASLARVRRAVASALEGGSGGPRALSPAWSWLSTRGAPLVASPGTLLVPVRGATLGGSWKTPVAIALTRALHERGEPAGLGAHAYGGSLRGARRVHAIDDVREVGDEALLAARSLHASVPIVAGHRRDDVAHVLASHARILVLDGHARRSGRGHAVVLALDAERPFGSGELVPRGDLRAPPAELTRDARWVLAIRDQLADDVPRIASTLDCTYDVSLPSGLEGARLAVVTAVARPSRVLASLARRGARVVGHVALADHGGPWARAVAERGLRRLAGFDAIVTTEKCATWLPRSLAGRPVETIALHLALPSALVDEVIALARTLGRASLPALQ